MQNQNYLFSTCQYDYGTYTNIDYCETINKNKAISIRNGEIIIQPMWRVELLAKAYNVNYCQDRENIDEYFEHVAKAAAKAGSERAELKCLIKSLILKYRKAKEIAHFPHDEFHQIADRLMMSDNSDYQWAGKKLIKYNDKQYKEYVEWRWDTYSY